MSEQETKFDFSGKETLHKRQQEQAIKKQRYDAFMKVGKQALAGILAISVVTGGGVFGYNAYQAHVDKQIAQQETIIKAIPKGSIIGLIQKEQQVAVQTFTQNQLNINKFGQYKELIEVMKYQESLAQLNANNSKLYKDIVQKLKDDNNQVEKVYQSLNGTRDQKIAELLDNSTDIEKFNQWHQAVENRQFMYVGGLIDLGKDVNQRLAQMEQTQNDLIKDVQARLKSGDFNLDKASQMFSAQIMKESQDEINDYNSARDELNQAKQAVQQGGDNASNIASLNDNEVKDATDAMNAMKLVALQQVADDKQKVEDLISQASKNNGLLPQTQQQQATQVSGNSPSSSTPIVVHTGPTFMDYYLMHTFLTAGSSNNSYNSGYSAGFNAGSTSAASLNKPAFNPSNAYSIKNESSLLNKSLAQNKTMSANMQKVLETNNLKNFKSVQSIRAQVDTSRLRMDRAMSTSMSELNRMGYTTSGKSSFSQKANSRMGIKAPTSSSGRSSISKSSSISRGGFSGGRSFGG